MSNRINLGASPKLQIPIFNYLLSAWMSLLAPHPEVSPILAKCPLPLVVCILTSTGVTDPPTPKLCICILVLYQSVYLSSLDPCPQHFSLNWSPLASVSSVSLHSNPNRLLSKK